MIVFFSKVGLFLELSYVSSAESIVDPPIWKADVPVGAVMRTSGWSGSAFTVVCKKW